MNVVCAINTKSLPSCDVDLLVLPEGVELDATLDWCSRCSSSIVVAAVREGKHMRALALHGKRNMIDYLKIGTDGRSTGTGRAPTKAFFEGPDFIIGVLVCMDFQNRYSIRLRDALLQSDKPTKILCIPADMDKSWFESEPIPGWNGVYIALSNNNTTYPEVRARSFIAGKNGGWISRQVSCEPIAAVIA